MALSASCDNSEWFDLYCKIRKFSREFYFRETSWKKMSSRICYITLTFIDIDESRPCRDFQRRKYVLKICYITLTFIDIDESRPCRDFQRRKYVLYHYSRK